MSSQNAAVIKPIVIGGILFAVTSQVIMMGEVMATMDIYMMPEYFPYGAR